MKNNKLMEDLNNSQLLTMKLTYKLMLELLNIFEDEEFYYRKLFYIVDCIIDCENSYCLIYAKLKEDKENNDRVLNNCIYNKNCPINEFCNKSFNYFADNYKYCYDYDKLKEDLKEYVRLYNISKKDFEKKFNPIKEILKKHIEYFENFVEKVKFYENINKK